MSVSSAVSSVLSVVALVAFAALVGTPGPAYAQTVSAPEVRSSVPARFEAGDTVRVSFRFQLPDSVDRARVRVLLLAGGEVVAAIRRVRPSIAEGAGAGQGVEIFSEPVMADAIRIVLSGPRGYMQVSEVPLGVTAGPGSGDLVRPGWIDPGGFQGSGEEDPTFDEDSLPEGRVVALAVDPRLPLAALAESRRDTLTVEEAIGLSPAALRRLTTQLDRSTVVLSSEAELSRRHRNPALAEALRSPEVSARLDQPLVPPGVNPPAAPDTAGAPGPWTIEPDGSMRRSYPDGSEEVIDAAGNRMTCAPEPGSEEMLCMMPLFAQIPRVIPSSEFATVDLAWLDSMDAWLEQLAADALSEMRLLVADDASIEAYLGLEEGQNLYQRLDQRLEFLNRLIN